MAENVELVQKGFRILLPSLAGYVAQQMNRGYGSGWWQQILSTLGDKGRDLPETGDYGALVDSMDIATCLRLLDWEWNGVFRKDLSKDFRTWSKELMGVRNKISHLGGEDYKADDTWRALDTMARLCEGFDLEGAEEIRSILREFRYGSSMGSTAVNQGNNTQAIGKSEAAVLTRLSGEKLPSWRQVIEPHPDVAQGRYLNAEFAANLAEVAKGSGAFEYRDPVEFFARTYVTEGMKGLLVQALKRFSGKDGEPVLQLKTAFGGGKTHSLLALYHTARGRMPLDKVPSLKPILDTVGVDHFPQVHVAVLVGTDLNPAKASRRATLPGVTINTMWGEMAAQLAESTGKPELYDIVKDADKKHMSPGAGALKQLFNSCGTCLVLMDEIVAYARKLTDDNTVPAGTFANFISFIQEITEAASASESSMVVASIPESDVEIGGDSGQKALEAIEHTFGRKESIWKPVAANEGFEVVRRRLFLDCKDESARNAVCTAFSKMYQDNPGDFPIEAREVEYRDRMVSCYPIHPEIFDRLYEEWATMEHFQRTRGVLRLMAAVIHELWMANDASAMIMPGSLTLDVPNVRDELVRYLPEAWNGIMDHEVDGRGSVPYQLDRSTLRYGQKLACRRVSRTIMLGSAPTNRAQSVRGIEASRIRLGIIQPGENIADFNDALNTLRGSLAYLYTDPSGNRYWYDTRPTLRKTATDRATQMAPSDVTYEIERRLHELRKEGPFAGIHICPGTSNDVSDDQAVRLVVLKTEDTHKQGQERSKAVVCAEDILNNRGSAPRVYRNMLAFVAPDQDALHALEKAVRELLAWQSIKKDSETLNLDAGQNTETQNNINRSNETVNIRLKETYCWLIVPFIDREVDMKELIWDVDRLSGGNESIVSKAANKMLQNEQLITKWAPALLKMELDNLLWKDSDHIQVKKLWEYMTTYCYLPRLSNMNVLESAIQAGVNSEDFFSLASSIEGERCTGLKYNTYVPSIYPTDYIVKGQIAMKQIIADREREAQQRQGESNPGGGTPFGASAGTGGWSMPGGGNPLGVAEGNGGSGFGPSSSGGQQTPLQPTNTRFFMSAKLDNTRVIRDVQKLMEEVVNLLNAANGANVEISLEVTATTDKGFDSNTVRAVTENCRTLKVDQSGFEE